MHGVSDSGVRVRRPDYPEEKEEWMSTIHKFAPTNQDKMRWSNVDKEAYSPNGVGSHMQRIISRKDGSQNIEFRYFMLNPTDRSNYEKHNYEHLVFIISGRGTILLGDKDYEIGPNDAIFISCDEVTQLRAADDERLVVHGEQYAELYDPITGDFKKRREWKSYDEMIHR